MILWCILLLYPVFTVQYYVPTNGQGTLVPLPQSVHYLPSNLSVVETSLKLVSTQQCDVIEKAMMRYRRLIFANHHTNRHMNQNVRPFGVLTIDVAGHCEKYPYFGMDEMYTLNVWENGTGRITSNSIWGALRGLETFSQLVFVPNQGPKDLLIRTAEIVDWPRFSHRGVLLDTSRHFLPLNSILETIELMAENKLNVFHWHIVDDQSFPYTSALYPNLSRYLYSKGAFSPAHVYSRQDMARVVEYGRVRGVRVVAEFDTPGHTTSWGKGQPGLLTQCYDNNGTSTGETHLINPTLQSTWNFILSFFAEVLSTFPDEYIHLGGDEVNYEYPCWTNNPDIKKFMVLYNFTTPEQVEQYYIQNLLKLVTRARQDTGYVVWQEVVDKKVKVQEDTIVHVWKGSNNRLLRAAELDKVTAGGFRTLLSSCWYLNYIKYGDDWADQYTCDPQDFQGTADQKNLVIGGEACMWGEWVDATNLTPRLWRGFPAEPASKWTFCPTPYQTNSPIY